MKYHFLLCLLILLFQLIFTASVELPNEVSINLQKTNASVSSTEALLSFKNGREGEILPSLNSSEVVTSQSSVEKLTTSQASVVKLTTSPSTVKKQLQSDEFGKEDSFEFNETPDTTTIKNSVYARKGVEDITPSVHARKGVEMEDMKSEELIMKNVTESTTSTYVHSESGANDIPKPPHTLPSTTTVAAKSTKLNDAVSTTTHAPKIISWTLPPLNISQHLKKPTQAVDAVESDYSSTTPVIVGLIFGLVLIIIIATLAYKKMQDVWSRRHYDRMDFLIDGMYDL